ncbi:MAG: hypothetical protein OXC82_00590 [Rhodobacteraceae bacterium]|nr:hypothetical protein [Paracoccaceae bacterium]MCY4248924.1 hypothetical protein [Paracoccaceae bacterium]
MPLPNWIESTGKGIGLIPVHCLSQHGNSSEADWNSPRVFLLLQAETTGNMGMFERMDAAGNFITTRTSGLDCLTSFRLPDIDQLIFSGNM